MTRRVARWGLGAALGLLFACGTEKPPVPTLRLVPEKFTIQVKAKGILETAEPSPIKAPPMLMGSHSIAYLADEGVPMKMGDPLVRLDDTPDREEMQKAAVERQKINLDEGIEVRRQKQARKDLESQVNIVEAQRDIASRYAARDPLIFSRNEIIESESNDEYLRQKSTLLKAQSQRQERKHLAQSQLLTLRRRTQEIKEQQLQMTLDHLQIASPHEGTFLARRDYQGKPLRLGSSVFRGMELGELPDLKRMVAKVWVLENEMAGVAVGQPATVTIDANPGFKVTAKVKTVEAVAQPLDWESPVKAFQVVLELGSVDLEVMKPGRSVSAQIFLADQNQVLVVPNQALFHDKETTFVHVRDGGGFVRRTVQLGARSTGRTVITKGLSAGEEVALAAPGN